MWGGGRHIEASVLPVHCQQEEPDEVEQRLDKGRAFLYRRVFLCVCSEHHRCTVLVLETEEPVGKEDRIDTQRKQRRQGKAC